MSEITKDQVTTANRFLTKEEMRLNARYVCQWLLARGWSFNAICGMLGNMQTESNINAGIWENCTVNETRGFGLVQWTPATKYLNWCSANNLEPADMDSALMRIEYEVENGLQYYPTTAYPDTFKEFKTSNKTPEYLAYAFLVNYERPANQNQSWRATQARAWYDYLKEYVNSDVLVPSIPSSSQDVKKHSLSLLMMYMATKR